MHPLLDLGAGYRLIGLANPNNHLKNQTPENGNHLPNLFTIRGILYGITIQILPQPAILSDENVLCPESLCVDDCCAGMDSWHVCTE